MPSLRFFKLRRKKKEPELAPPKEPVPRKESFDELSDSEDDDTDVVEELAELPQSYQTRKGRTSVSAEVYGEHNKKGDFKPPTHHKTDEQAQRIRSVLKNSFLFSTLDEPDIQTVILAFTEKNLKQGTTIIQQGEDGECLYLLESGECEVWKQKPGEEEPKLVFLQTPGDAFGELALLYNCPRAATVKAKTDVGLWVLDRESFNHIVKEAAARKRDLYEDFLKRVDLLKDMDPYERTKVADALKTVTCEKEQIVITEGEAGNTFYIVEEGEAEAVKNEEIVLSYKAGDYFGELALIKDQPRAATIRAKTDLKLVALDRRSFKRLLGPVEDLLKRNAESYTQFKDHLT